MYRTLKFSPSNTSPCKEKELERQKRREEQKKKMEEKRQKIQYRKDPSDGKVIFYVILLVQHVLR
jgi:hypothetical protein